MIDLIDRAIIMLKNSNEEYQIYTTSIWTDANSAASSISFDSYEHSENKIKASNEWNKTL